MVYAFKVLNKSLLFFFHLQKGFLFISLRIVETQSQELTLVGRQLWGCPWDLPPLQSETVLVLQLLLTGRVLQP